MIGIHVVGMQTWSVNKVLTASIILVLSWRDCNGLSNAQGEGDHNTNTAQSVVNICQSLASMTY